MNYSEIEQFRAQAAAHDAKRDAGLTPPKGIVIHRDLPYGPYGVENLCDIYYPEHTTHALPTIVSIHGGGFCYGDKELYQYYTMFLATQGFTVINFNYRLAPEHAYPAPLEDTNALMHFLLAHQKTYFIDPNHLFLLGDSAGGQLTEQYATILTNPEYAKTFSFTLPKLTFSAVGLNCGHYFMGEEDTPQEAFDYYFNGVDDALIVAQFPVEAHLTSNFPPTFLMTASDDFLKELAPRLKERLDALQIPLDYHCYANADGSHLGHVFHIDQKSAIAKQCNIDELAFFKRYL